MNIDQHYAGMLDAMDKAVVAPVAFRWAEVGDLTQRALALLDAGGCGHHAAARALSSAMSAIEAELHQFGEGAAAQPRPDRAR